MNETQAEIKRIQAKLQELGQNTRRKSLRSAQLATPPPSPGRSPDLSTAVATARYPELDLPGGDRYSSRGTPTDLESGLRLSSQTGLGYVEPGAIPDALPPLVPKQPKDGQFNSTDWEDCPPGSKSAPAFVGRSPEGIGTQGAAATDGQQLDQQAQLVNELASALETALLEMKVLATRWERQHPQHPTRLIWEKQATGGSDSLGGDLAHGSTVPHVERDAQGTFILKTRSIGAIAHETLTAAGFANSAPDPGQLAEWRAQQVADRLRQQTALRGDDQRPIEGTELARLDSAWGKLLRMMTRLGRQMGGLLGLDHTRSGGRPRHPLGQAPRRTPTPKITVQDAVLWVTGAAIARVALDLLLASYPTLWLPVAAMVVTPAAIAIYCTAVDPDSSFTMGRRLLFVMVGLLIGGRLF
ncbi:MAG: hypothetical protein VKK04_07115 [Synechococcales bacterium]|nr:hypothetical protein [Synechococcales bacterium]